MPFVCSCQSLSVAACMAEDECQAEIPFAGTGITIYVLNAGFQGVNASLSVDGKYSVNGTVPPPTPPSYQTPRVSLLAIQSLPYDYHIATLSILDWDGSNTSLYFDYALIEDANIQTTTSQLPTLTPTPAPPASSSLASTPPITMITMAALPTTSTTTTMRRTTGTTTGASSSSASSCSNCLRAIEIAAPCIISALLAAGIIFYLKSRRAKAKKEDNRVAPFTDMPSAPLPLIPAVERKARMRAAQSWVLGVHTEAHFSDRPSVRDGLLSEGSSGVGRESPTCGGGSEESDEIHIMIALVLQPQVWVPPRLCQILLLPCRAAPHNLIVVMDPRLATGSTELLSAYLQYMYCVFKRVLQHAVMHFECILGHAACRHIAPYPKPAKTWLYGPRRKCCAS
ncbi:hypothetical protein BKA82DRAFT_598504 [Pisolithus tinctorius]|nr:hypothetical protein BKA82DRAFT_598504 [Pisolithus tinctorius]